MTKKTMFFLPAITRKLKIAVRLMTMLLLLAGLEASAFAPDALQQRKITGRIVDSNGEGLIGVNILEKGTTNGAISEANGTYTINTTSANPVLSFSFIGYITQDITVGAQNTIDVTLAESISALDEIVVVGYSTQTRKSLTGSVAQVDAAALQESAATNPITRLQGKVAGVTIMNQHTPGEGSSIRVRGMTTINNSDPLYVVDGVPGGSYSPNDIETITILKDAAAQSIYGARAANGVVLITTKAGKKNQKISMNVNVRQGITKNTTSYDLLNTQEWAEMYWLQAKNGNVAGYSHQQFGNGAQPVIPKYIYPTAASTVDMSKYDNKMANEDGTDTYLITEASAGTDWLKEAEQNGAFKEYTIDAAGGSGNTTYAFLLGYTSDEGVFKWTGFDRYSGRININSSPAKWIDLGTNLSLQYTDDYGFQANDNSESSPVSWAYRMPPIVPVWDASGTTYAGSRPTAMGNSQNVVFLLDKNQYDYTRQMTVSGTAYMKLNLLKGLSVKSLIGVNQYGRRDRDLGFVEVAHAERGTYDSYNINSRFGLNWTWTNTIEYGFTTGQHNFKVIAGTEAYDNDYWRMNAGRSEFQLKDVNYISLNTGLRGISNSDEYSKYSLFSIFGRANYTFADKYMVEAVLRRDGSSRFGNEKYGIFPAFSLGWRLSEESFMASTKSWLNELKLRVGYGSVGNDQMGNYNSYTQYAYSEGNASYPLTGSNSSFNPGFSQTTFGNADVKWETTNTTNFGIDATIIKNLNVSIDLWQRVTKDMLYQKQLPLVLGTATRPSINIGEMKNTGFDITIGYFNTALNGDFTYSADLVFSHYKNELTKLTDISSDFYQGSSYREKIYTRTQTGHAFPEFYGYVVEGIFQSDEEVNGWPKAFGSTGTYNAPGSYKYKDIDGNGYIDAADRTYIGSPHPDFTAGLSLNLGYKNFSLSTTLYTSVGNDVVNYVSRFIDFTQFESGKSKRRLYESWGSPYLADNADATMPKILATDTQHQEPSTAFIEDGSFLRMKTLRIGYDFNKLLNNRFSSLQLYFQASNLFTITKYPGLDPEIAIPSSAINMGIDSGAWPTAKQFMFGISFGL
ncbi:MAG TPA: TonB-dependent receptor [Bacteroidales bacterium]|nr:TonB-dependent receptor [Bacteroidales bacterium]